MSGILLLDRNLQRNVDVWGARTDSSVNPVPADYFGAMSGGDDGTMVVTNGYGGDKAYAGGLVSNKRPFPQLNNQPLQYIAMHIEFMWPKYVYGTQQTPFGVARHETDLKVCFKTRPTSTTYIRNVANFSVQWNRDTGEFQIDHDPPAWVGCGFFVADIAPDVWHSLDFRFFYDPVALTFSILSIQLDGELYEMPKEHQDIPAQNTNWEEVASVQLQNEMFSKGSTIIVYNHVTLGWSDQPIGTLDLSQIMGEGFGVFLL
jgi:hypothetical protein